MNLAMMRSNTAFIDSQRMYSALRLFCKYGAKDDLAKPFWSVSRGYVYAANGPCAIRIETAEVPPVGEVEESVHAKNFDVLMTECEQVRSFGLFHLNEAAEVALAICRERNGVVDDGRFDERSELAFVSIPEVGIFQADYLLGVVRAFGLINQHSGERMFLIDLPEKRCVALRCDSLDGHVSALVCGQPLDYVIDGRWVVVEVGSLRERKERDAVEILRSV